VAKKANIEINVDGSQAHAEVEKLIDDFDSLGSSATESSSDVEEVTEAVESVGDQGDASLPSVESGFSKLGAAAVSVNQVLELMGKVWSATFGAALEFMDEAKAMAIDMRSEFDPMVAQLDSVNNEFDELKGLIGDSGLIAETALKQSLLPTIEMIKGEVGALKSEWAVSAAETSAVVMELTAFLMSTDGLGGFFIDFLTASQSLWAKFKAGWANIFGFLTLAFKKTLESMPWGDWTSEIEGANTAMDYFGETIEDAKVKVAGLDKQAQSQKETLDKVSFSLLDASTKVVQLTKDLADVNQEFGNLASSDFNNRMNDLVFTLGGNLPDALARFKEGLDLESKVLAFTQLQKEIDTVGATLMKLRPGSGEAFDVMHGKVKAIYDQLGVPLPLDFKDANAQQKLDMLRASFESLKENAAVATGKVSLALSMATQEATKLEESVTMVTESFSDKMANAAQSLQQNFGAMFGSFITGTESAGKAAKKFASLLLTTVIDAMIQTMTVDATKTAIGAASSVAGIPIVGPGLAVTAAITMLTFLKGLIGSLTGAAEGGFVTGGIQRKDSVPMLLQPGEYVMPVDEVRGMKKFAAQMGSGSGLSSGGGRSQVNISFNSTLPATRTQAKEIMRRDILPLLRDLEAGGY
tara:strand:+ start:10312 stop:12228 length:1917 start_codon:yes stop_codon:yes gene_type:complete